MSGFGWFACTGRAMARLLAVLPPGTEIVSVTPVVDEGGENPDGVFRVDVSGLDLPPKDPEGIVREVVLETELRSVDRGRLTRALPMVSYVMVSRWAGNAVWKIAPVGPILVGNAAEKLQEQVEDLAKGLPDPPVWDLPALSLWHAKAKGIPVTEVTGDDLLGYLK